MQRKIILFFATGAGLGYIPKASGTFGTLLAVFLYLSVKNLSLFSYLLFVLTFIFFSVWVSTLTENYLQEKDSSKIVIDEIAGFLVTMIGLPSDWLYIALGFGLFRLFDITKPLFIRTLEKNYKGGFGVVIDDVAAGFVANLILQILHWRWP